MLSRNGIRYTDGIGDWNVRTASLTGHLQHLRAHHGSTTRCEFLEHGCHTIPYFDYDAEFPDPPTLEQTRASWDLCRHTITQIFGAHPDFDFDSRVAHAHRHGFVPAKHVHKLSLRFWVRGYRILPEHMPLLIRACTPPEAWEVFDLSIYSKRRLLACVGGIKGGGDERVLEVDGPLGAEWCVCQRLEGNEINLDLSSETTASSQTKAVAPADWSRLKAVLEAHGFRDPVYVGRRELSVHFTAGNLGIDCPCCPHVHDSQVCENRLHLRICRPLLSKAKPKTSCRTGGSCTQQQGTWSRTTALAAEPCPCLLRKPWKSQK